MNRVILSLGSNIDKEVNLPAAVRLLRDLVPVIAVSPIYETSARGTEDQPDFYNAAVLIETELGPREIKDQIIDEVERRLNRQRQADKNAPRTIDLDIALFNDAVLDYVPTDGRPRHIPDKDLLRWLHVIVPVADLAPDQLHPETGEQLKSIAECLMEQHGGDMTIRPREDISLAE
jgi:2-amino-4-hydroxy-6-hydroxymethyldihydropteridine diphosphokinase